MKKDWKYILYISVAFGLFVVVKLMAPKQYDWSVTFNHRDKNPYGAYALDQLLPTIFPAEGITHSYQTLYEIKDSLKRVGNVLIITRAFSAGKEDTNALLKHVETGGSAFISSQYFWGHLIDTLDFSAADYLFKEGNIFDKKDTSELRLVNPTLDTTQRYGFRRDNVYNYFEHFDTTKTTVIARNDKGYPITIRIAWGKGNIILNSTPLAFTNIYLLSKDHEHFVSQMLSYLPKAPLEWTEFYHLGRMESETPLRYILTTEPLRWAYYLAIVGLLIFMVFEMKRKQRIIPVVKPLANTTLEFVSTIGNLYLQNKEHKKIAEKKIAFLLEHIRSKFYLNTNKLDAVFFEALSRKSGKSETEIVTLFKTVTSIQAQPHITEQQLIELNKQIENFNSPVNKA
jgi:hypothetical protein